MFLKRVKFLRKFQQVKQQTAWKKAYKTTMQFAGRYVDQFSLIWVDIETDAVLMNYRFGEPQSNLK